VVVQQGLPALDEDPLRGLLREAPEGPGQHLALAGVAVGRLAGKGIPSLQPRLQGQVGLDAGHQVHGQQDLPLPAHLDVQGSPLVEAHVLEGAGSRPVDLFALQEEPPLPGQEPQGLLQLPPQEAGGHLAVQGLLRAKGAALQEGEGDPLGSGEGVEGVEAPPEVNPTYRPGGSVQNPVNLLGVLPIRGRVKGEGVDEKGPFIRQQGPYGIAIQTN